MRQTLVREILGAAWVVLAFGGVFWRTFRQNRGNKRVEFGVITVSLFLACIFLFEIPGLPFRIVGSMMALVVLLCFATLFILGQRIFRALRRKST
jgi:hypothetical protein